MPGDRSGPLEKDPDILEQHYQRAGEHARAAVAAIASGDRIARNYSGPEARRRYLAAADLTDSADKSGFIGLQVHGIKGDETLQVRWRNLRIKELD